MKPPISYYGGKQNLASKIVKLIPSHNLYCEPFCGGAAIFFNKPKSEVEVLNDTNKELINFYEVVQRDYVSLAAKIRITLHSRTQHKDAQVTFDNPHLFDKIERAWAVWVLATQSFSSKLDGSWGYDKKRNTTPKKVSNKREMFTEEYAIRLQDVQIECTDALRIITSRDNPDAFFYVDPPYYNSDCGHYDGYSLEDYTALLDRLSKIEGKFLLSSYPSEVLNRFKHDFGWFQETKEMRVSVNKGSGKKKIEVFTANYDFNALESSKQALRA